MTCASGFAWVAREPQLIGGALGARILTEINSITHIPRLHQEQTRSPASVFAGSSGFVPPNSPIRVLHPN